MENSPREEAISCRRGKDGGWGEDGERERGGGGLKTDQFWHENGEVMKNIRAFSAPPCASALQLEEKQAVYLNVDGCKADGFISPERDNRKKKKGFRGKHNRSEPAGLMWPFCGDEHHRALRREAGIEAGGKKKDQSRRQSGKLRSPDE